MIAIGTTGMLTGGALSVWQSGSIDLWRGLNSSVVDGYWVGDLDVGSSEADLQVRARIARKGLYALKRSEAVYYTRSLDDSGRPLDASCTYRLSGYEIPARWWSITLYDDESFLARNDDKAHSINSETIEYSANAWEAKIGPVEPSSGPIAGNLLSTKGTTSFDLTLRLYEPIKAFPAGAVEAGFPKLERLACEV